MVLRRIQGKPLINGSVTGRALVTDTPLSFWGGVNPENGRVIDKRHPLAGEFLTGRILILPSGRGSCSASGVLLESISNDTAPAGIVLSEMDPVIGMGAILGDELLERVVPVVLVSAEERVSITTGVLVRILDHGMIEIEDDSGVFAPES